MRVRVRINVPDLMTSPTDIANLPTSELDTKTTVAPCLLNGVAVGSPSSADTSNLQPIIIVSDCGHRWEAMGNIFERWYKCVYCKEKRFHTGSKQGPPRFLFRTMALREKSKTVDAKFFCPWTGATMTVPLAFSGLLVAHS